MMKTKKGRARRFLSILLAVIMVLSMISANGGALAAYAEEEQTSSTSGGETESGISVSETDTLKETESSEESRDMFPGHRAKRQNLKQQKLNRRTIRKTQQRQKNPESFI